MAILKRKSFQRETGLMDEESYQEYLNQANPPTPSESVENQKLEKKKWPKYTRWYNKIPQNIEIQRLREQSRDLGIHNIIW